MNKPNKSTTYAISIGLGKANPDALGERVAAWLMCESFDASTLEVVELSRDETWRKDVPLEEFLCRSLDLPDGHVEVSSGTENDSPPLILFAKRFAATYKNKPTPISKTGVAFAVTLAVPHADSPATRQLLIRSFEATRCELAYVEMNGKLAETVGDARFAVVESDPLQTRASRFAVAYSRSGTRIPALVFAGYDLLLSVGVARDLNSIPKGTADAEASVFIPTEAIDESLITGLQALACR